MSPSMHQLSIGKKNCFYEKNLRIVAFMLRILPKKSGNRTNDGSKNDPDELLEAEHRFFLLVQTESFPANKKNLLKFSPLR